MNTDSSYWRMLRSLALFVRLTHIHVCLCPVADLSGGCTYWLPDDWYTLATGKWLHRTCFKSSRYNPVVEFAVSVTLSKMI
jgi:hypothetical protein